MKKILNVGLIVFVCFMMVGCGKKNDKFVVMSTSNPTKTSISVELKNETKNMYSYDPFILEEYDSANDAWMELPGSELLLIGSKTNLIEKEEKKLKFDWSDTYGELSKGKYRVRTMLSWNDSKRGDNLVSFLFSEFEIN